MSLLPKLNNVPKYDLTIPSSKKEIKVRPFLVKEEKIMLIAVESQDPKQIATSVLDTVKSCIMTDVDSTKLTSYEIEYLFLQIRSKSVGETAKLLFKCTSCQEENEVTINLNDIKMEVKHAPNVIEITDNISIEMQHPSYLALANSDTLTKGTPTEQIFSIIKEAVVSVMTENERIDMREVDSTEFQEFLESMTQAQFQKVKDYLETIPKLSHTANFKCIKCATDNSVLMEGLQSFL